MTVGTEFASAFTQVFDTAKQAIKYIPIEQNIDGFGHSPGESEGSPSIIYGVAQPITAQMRRETEGGWVDTAEYVLYVVKGSQSITARDLVRFPLNSDDDEDTTTQEYEVMESPEDWGLGGIDVFKTWALRRRQIDRS